MAWQLMFWPLLIMSITLHKNYQVLAQKGVHNIGVCYGLNGDNLPSPKDAINLYKQYGIGKMRIYEPNHDVLEALRGSKIELVLGVKNQDLPTLASGEDAAMSWFATNVGPYVNDINISYINLGNEVIPGEFSDSILPAMQNLQNVLLKNNLGTKTTTVVHPAVLGASYPPSASLFSDKASSIITNIINFLSHQKSPLLVNLYTYFPYASNPVEISLDYAQFTATKPVIQDGSLNYLNLFDSMVDSFLWAMEKVGVSDVDLVVAETGWPHAGNGNLTNPDLAATYNKMFIQHVDDNVHGGIGTPKRPNASIEGFIFAMFDEDLKDQGVEQHWGLFNPTTMQPNYDVFN